MPNRLEHAVSPYLRLHADNPVDWQEWGPAAFDEARERSVPVLVSIGYATCHWCHVMARESFSDPEIAEVLRQGFVSVKVDREERPDVDASCMAAASAFTDQLGWPLTVFATPEGRVFYAGTYYPPTPVGEHPSFRQILAAVTDAWVDRRDEVEQNAAAIAAAVRAPSAVQELPSPEQVHAVVPGLVAAEDPEFAGFGTAPKFPNAPLLELLAELGADTGDEHDRAGALADRTIRAIARSALRDPVDGGVFRYATRRDWTVPHYERMLYDNAGLLATAGVLIRRAPQDAELRALAEGIVSWLRTTLRVQEGRLTGAFVAGQDSESTIDGRRVEGAWFALDAGGRAGLAPPPLDDQVLTGWNGLAIRSLAIAGGALGDGGMLDDARAAADAVLAAHTLDGAVTVRSSTPRGPSSAPPTLEDVGLLTDGLVELALATGEVRWASAALRIVDPLLTDEHPGGPVRFRPAAPADEMLASAGTAPSTEQVQTALRSGTVGLAQAAWRLSEMTGRADLDEAARSLLAGRAFEGIRSPLGYADALALAVMMGRPAVEVVIVEPDTLAATDSAEQIRAVARSAAAPGVLVSRATASQALAFAEAGFTLWEGRSDVPRTSAFVCHDRVCDLPVTTADALRAALGIGAARS